MLNAFFRIRWVSVLAVVSALFGGLLMFVLGSLATVEAFSLALGLKEAHLVGGPGGCGGTVGGAVPEDRTPDAD